MTVSLRDFEAGTILGADFHHRDHVRVAYELLARDPFDLALARYVTGLRGIAAAAGVPTKVHMTITVAFLAALAERLARHPAPTWHAFAERNPELLDKTFIRRWYAADELESSVARQTFVLPAAR